MIVTMQRLPQAKQNQAIRKNQVKPLKQSMFSISMVGFLILAILTGLKLFAFSGPDEQSAIEIEPPAAPFTASPDVLVTPLPDISPQPVANPNPSPTPRRPFTRDPNKPLVGIVSGHRGYDPGAVCSDGLAEVDVNYAIALEVVSLLERRGIQANLLDEYDDRLTEYEAQALVSIHADSCNISGASGFKVARVTDSAIPTAEDKLVECLNRKYGLYTGLAQHPASITDNMTNYHAFNEIASHTPGAIIETGFLLDDRYLLQRKPKIVARGIAAGIICFLEK